MSGIVIVVLFSLPVTPFVDDLPCRDFVEVEDLVQRRILYTGCTEQSKPLTINTGTHIARIKLKTTTKTAYPKRGILIHYQSE